MTWPSQAVASYHLSKHYCKLFTAVKLKISSSRTICVERNLFSICRWSCGLKRRSSADCLLGLRVRIPLVVLIFVVFVVRNVGSVLFDELIACPEESYRVCACVCLVVCDSENSKVRRLRTGLEFWATETRKKKKYLKTFTWSHYDTFTKLARCVSDVWKLQPRYRPGVAQKVPGS